jgi:hypothetical protein
VVAVDQRMPALLTPTATQSLAVLTAATGGGGGGSDVVSGWAVGALSGSDRGGGISWAGEACALLPCPQPGPRCLDYQLPPAPAPARR